jgi:hypothetical protein
VQFAPKQIHRLRWDASGEADGTSSRPEFHLQYDLQQCSVYTFWYDVTRWIPHQFSGVAFAITGAAACMDVDWCWGRCGPALHHSVTTNFLDIKIPRMLGSQDGLCLFIPGPRHDLPPFARQFYRMSHEYRAPSSHQQVQCDKHSYRLQFWGRNITIFISRINWYCMLIKKL